MQEYKTLLGSLGSLIALLGYLLYLRGVVKRTIRPHAFSWLVWATLTGIAFVAQLTEGAGAGAWVTGITSLSCLIIFFGAISWGDRRFRLFDWISLAAAGASLGLWLLTSDPFLSVLLIVLVDLFGSLPTFRKGYYRPREELMKSYAFSAVASVLAILALATYTPATWLYPAAIALLDGSLTALLLARRILSTVPDSKGTM